MVKKALNATATFSATITFDVILEVPQYSVDQDPSKVMLAIFLFFFVNSTILNLDILILGLNLDKMRLAVCSFSFSIN